MLLTGYCEGIDSERGIAWRVADSLSLSGRRRCRSRRKVLLHLCCVFLQAAEKICIDPQILDLET
jgi:hypothetical protein